MYLFLVNAEDGLVGVSSHRTRRPLGVFLPNPLLGDGCETNCLPGAELHDANAALGGVPREGGREGGKNVSGSGRCAL